MFAFQCDDLVRQQIAMQTELDLARKNHCMFKDEMDKTVLKFDVNRKQKNWNG